MAEEPIDGQEKEGDLREDPSSHRPIVGLIHAQRHVAGVGQERQQERRRRVDMNSQERNR